VCVVGSAALPAELEEVQQMGGPIVSAASSAAAKGPHLIHQARRELGVGKADGRCGRFGQKGGRIHGVLNMAREVGRVGVGMVAVEGLTAVAVVELAVKLGTGARARPGTGRRLEAKLSEQ